MKPYEQQNYYELLDLPVSASTEEIYSAFRRAMELHDPSSAAMYALADPTQIEDLRSVFVRAKETLTDLALRADYDRSLGLANDLAPSQLTMNEILRASSIPPRPPPPIERRGYPAGLDREEPEPTEAPPETPLAATAAPPERAKPGEEPVVASAEPTVPVAPVATHARTKPKEIPPDAEFNGELLRQIRETKGLSLQQVGERTRISVRHLENVEADRYDALPATVYLRGMLMSLARELKLDPIRVARSYLMLVTGTMAKEK